MMFRAAPEMRHRSARLHCRHYSMAIRRRRNPVSAVSKRYGISEQTIYTWRKRFGGFEASDVRRLKHARLKMLVAERDPEIEVMKEVASKNW